MITIHRCKNHDDFFAAKNFVNAHHSYIQWADRPSRKMYWTLMDDDRLVGVFGLGSAFARPKPVQVWMQTNHVEFNELGNNIVFCLYGATTPNFGSSVLRLLRRDAAIWWKERYGDSLKALQTFILPPRNGAVYLADNWQNIGMTSGSIQTVRTIQKSDLHLYADTNVKQTQFKSGEVKYLLRGFSTTPQKIILIKKL